MFLTAPLHDSCRSAQRHPPALRIPRTMMLSLYCVALLSLIVCGQENMGWPQGMICLFDHHRTVVVESTLFVDGGEWVDNEFFATNNTAWQVKRFQNEYIWKLDLTHSVTAANPTWEVEEKPSDPDEHYNGAEGIIWNVGMGTFVTVGGWFSPRSAFTGELFGEPYTDEEGTTRLPEARMFTYNIHSRKWSSETLPKGVPRISTASWASSERKRRGYILGGLIVPEEYQGLIYPPITDTWLSTMTQYDFTTKQWKTEDLPSEIGKTVDGGLPALDRVGDDGVLVFLGGQERLDDSRPMRSMETIWVYDIATSQWHSQTTTGEIPRGRRQSCFFVVPAPDHSSYQIYTFSGAVENEVSILDLYVLTVPAFIWKKVPLTYYPDTYPMNAHQCSPYAEGRHILIVPGNVNASNTAQFQWLCNNGTGIKIFDTLEWTFSPSFTPTETIGVPKWIVALIGGTTQGEARVKEPEGGWQSQTLGLIFRKRNDPIIYNYDDNDASTTSNNSTSSDSNNTTTPPLSDSDDPTSQGLSKPSGGAIAGIAVGVVIGVLALGGIFFCGSCRKFLRKRIKDREALPLELAGQSEPVEVACMVPVELAATPAVHAELGTGYLPAELMVAKDAERNSYPLKAEEKSGYTNTEVLGINGEVREINGELPVSELLLPSDEGTSSNFLRQ